MPASRRRRRLGQHFLIDPRVADRILDHARLTAADRVLEIGPGTGFLTRRLADRCARVVAVESDPAMVARLERAGLGPERIDLVRADATRVALEALPPFNKVVANLPYSVSTPLTFRLLPLRIDLHVLMYQREFAQRLVAEPGSDDYGRLAAARAYWARAEYLETVPRSAFRPPPDVASAIVRLAPHDRPPFAVASPQAYEDLLRVVFSTRRKTLRASLRRRVSALGLPDAATLDRALASWGQGDRRPEELTPPQLGELTLVLAEAARRG